MDGDFSSALALVSIGVVLEQRELKSAWQSHAWVVSEVVPMDAPCEPADGRVQSASLGVFADELEGYFLNLSTEDPRVFVLLRTQEDGSMDDCPVVHAATLSYNEAARWMDAGERVDSIGMPEPFKPWLAEYVDRNYKPEPKKRRRPASFVSPEKRDAH